MAYVSHVVDFPKFLARTYCGSYASKSMVIYGKENGTWGTELLRTKNPTTRDLFWHQKNGIGSVG